MNRVYDSPGGKPNGLACRGYEVDRPEHALVGKLRLLAKCLTGRSIGLGSIRDLIPDTLEQSSALLARLFHGA
jgi:hypothetical protein